ncbi:ferredoxin [Nonomuraea sp. NPDC050547]|uniref:ferredoxin n=1 Tax=unclassified Nonomuraea TaxID=2593643 RepID=UPI00379AC356
MHIDVDTPACVGAGQCALLAPDVFDQRDDDGLVVLLRPQPAPQFQEATRQAAQVCPAMAIKITE